MIEEIVQQATTTTTAGASQPIDPTSVALLSIAVSGALAFGGLYLTYQSRRQPHREFLYAKQIEAYDVLANAITRLTQPLYDFISAHNYELTPESRAEMRRLYNKLFQNDFSAVESKLRWIIPNDVMDAVGNLTGTIGFVVWEDDQTESLQKMRKEPWTYLTEAETDVIDAMRKSAGVDPLSEEMRKVFFGRRVPET